MKELHQVYKKENSEESGRWKKIPVVLQACRQSLSFLCVFHYQKSALEIHFNAWLIAMRRSQGKDKGDSRNLSLQYHIEKYFLNQKKNRIKNQVTLWTELRGTAPSDTSAMQFLKGEVGKKNGRQNLGSMWNFSLCVICPLSILSWDSCVSLSYF